MIYVLKGKRFRFWPHVAVFAAYTLLAILPQTAGPAWTGSLSNRLAWWPLVLAVAIMIVCMITDAFHRPVIERVAFVVVGVVLYLAITWPLFQLIGYWLLRHSNGPRDLATDNATWAMMRTYAAFPLVVYSLRRSRFFEKPRKEWEGEE